MKVLPWDATVGCNNGGGGGNFWNVKRLVAKWTGARKRLFSGFFAAQGGILQTQKLFPIGMFYS